MIRRLELLLVSAILVVAAFSTGFPYLFFLLYLAILVIGGSYVLVRLGLTDLEAGYAVSQLHGHVGDRMRVTYTLRNGSRLPKLWLEVHNPTTLPGALPGRALTLGGRSERSWLIRVPLSRRGHFRIEPLHIRTGDPFGFFEAAATVGQGVSVVVYPRLEPIPAWRLPAAILEGSHASPERTFQTTPLATSVRPYAPGDAMNRIHWKTTARHGEIQVKEFDLEQTADAWIVLDLQRGIGGGRGDESTTEAAIGSRPPSPDKAIAENRAVGFTVNAGRTAFLPADRGGRQHQKIMQLLAAVEADGQSPLVETLISTVGRLRRGMTAVVITPSLDPSWVRPLASLRTRGVACVVVTFDIGAYDQAARDSAAAVTGEYEVIVPADVDAAAKRARALRHALAEYELPSYVVTRAAARRDPHPMNRRIPLAPPEGWLSVGLVAVLCVTMAAAIDDVAPILARDDFTDLLVPMAIAGMLVGLIGAKVGWNRWLTYLIGAGFAALIVPLAVGELLVQNAPIPVENAGTLAAAYHETATSLVHAATDLLVLHLQSTNQYGHFILVLGLLVWGTAMFASFTTFGHGRPLNAILVVGLLLLVNMSLTTRDQLVFLVLYSLASLFLLIRYHVLEEQAEWVRRRIGDPASISGVYLRGGTLFIVAAIGGSLLLTNVASSDPLRGAWGGLSGGLIELSHSIQRYLPMGDNSRSFGADFDPSGTRISGRWNPDQSLEVTIQLPADEKRPFYWRVTTFDTFALNSWTSTAGASILRNPGEALLDGSADSPNPDPNVTQAVQFTVTPDRYTGRPILSPLTPSVVDQGTQVGLVGNGSFLGTIQRDGTGPYNVTALVPIKGNDPGQLNEENLRSAGTHYPVEVSSLYLTVPPGAMPDGGKAEQLYDQLVAEAPSLTPFDFASFLQDRFRDSGPDRLFKYDTDLFDLLSGPCKDLSSVECFATYREGFCQYYASTMAIFLREQGIPSRIVEGFLPGKRTARGEEPILNSQSHEWVEVYFPGYGWVPFDPTGGSVAQLEALPSGPPVTGTPRPALSFAPPSRPVGDGIDEPNDAGAGTIANKGSPAGPLIGMAILLSVIVGSLAFVAWQRGPRSGTTADHAYRTVTRLARRFGFGPRPTQTVYEFSGGLGEVLPIARPELEMVASAKVETSYGRGVLGEDRLRALRDAERRLKLNMLRLALRRKDRRRR